MQHIQVLYQLLLLDRSTVQQETYINQLNLTNISLKSQLEIHKV